MLNGASFGLEVSEESSEGCDAIRGLFVGSTDVLKRKALLEGTGFVLE